MGLRAGAHHKGVMHMEGMEGTEKTGSAALKKLRDEMIEMTVELRKLIEEIQLNFTDISEAIDNKVNVVIAIEQGGHIDVIQKPDWLRIIVRDYNIDGVDRAALDFDDNKRPYVFEEF
jgi:hypothetical protein